MELLRQASGYLGDILRLCSGRRIAGGKGAIALAIKAIRAIRATREIEFKIKAIDNFKN